jgi:GTPase SAR1 family protein
MVGKTSILLRYHKDEFSKAIERTVNVNCINKSLNINNSKYNLNIWVALYLIRTQPEKKSIMR